MKHDRCQDYIARGMKVIPGLTQLLSKRPDQFAPGTWPTYFRKAKGVEVWDLDGNRYIDMSISGIGANVLGYCDRDVDCVVKRVVDAGNSSSLVGPEEVDLAEILCAMHPWAQMARFCRGGGEAMMIAVRIVRAATKRDKVAFCGYHGWHDWYLSANLTGDKLSGHLLPGLNPLGVPQGLQGTALPFRYNDVETLEKIVEENSDSLAAIILEPIRDHQPKPGFLERVRALANESGAFLVFDEVSSGFRLNSAGAHLLFGIEPDVAVFAKAISNGYPMGAVIGKEKVMNIAQETFISSTYWTERIGPAAALATIQKHQRLDVSAHLIKIGEAVQSGWAKIAKEEGLDIEIGGIPPLSHFNFKGEKSIEMMTLFVQEMLKRGFLASHRFYSNYSHQFTHVEDYLGSAKKVFSFIGGLRTRQDYRTYIEGAVARPGFGRLT